MSSPLQRENIIDFNHIPSIGELFEHTTGWPGVEYAIVSNANSHTYMEDGYWNQLHGAPIFKIDGHPCVVLGHGKPIDGLGPSDSKCRLFVDNDIPLAARILISKEAEKVEVPTEDEDELMSD